MEQKKFDKDKLIRYWIEGADEDFDTMTTMLENKKYNCCSTRDVVWTGL